MKKLLFVLVTLLYSVGINAQEYDYVDRSTAKIFIVITQNGGEFVGTITKNDSKEIIVQTKELGPVAIPKYQVKKIEELTEKNVSRSGGYVANQVFATRYLGTTNALSIAKGESYVKYSLVGPDINFGVADNVTIGVMTTWLAAPVLVTGKYAHQINETTHIAGGLMVGNLGWASLTGDLGFNLMLVPFGAFTKGTRRKNVNLALGYGQVWADGGSAGALLGSIGCMAHMGKSSSFVFDSLFGTITYAGSPTTGFTSPSGLGMILTPGFRFQKREDAAFQFGFSFFAGSDGGQFGASPLPLPRFAWFRKF